MVAVALEVFELLSAMLVGLREHVEYWGAPVHARATVLDVPPSPCSWIGKVAVCPLVMIADEVPLIARRKSSPCPDKVTVRVLGRFVAEIVRVPVVGPAVAAE
jgi:hypothetical protein